MWKVEYTLLNGYKIIIPQKTKQLEKRTYSFEDVEVQAW
jgi:hypothetical protein